MKVLHINTRQTAGAALCAMRINRALVNEGVSSRMLFAERETMPEGISGAIAKCDKSFWYAHPLLLRLKYLLVRLPLWPITDKERMERVLRDKNDQLDKPLYMHGPYTNYKNIAKHPLVKWADVIHLHWVAGMVDYPTFFREVKKPIVWTLHDVFPAVGILHFESDFYPVPESLMKLDAYCKNVKRDSVMQAKSLSIVAISELMAERCRKSDVLKGFPVSIIHNGVDTEVFRPYDKATVRRKLGLSEKANIFLFSANSLDDDNKGLDRLLEALQQVNTQNMMLVCIGLNNGKQNQLSTSFPIKMVGYVNDTKVLAEYYSAADYFCQCSYIESFGQTVIEAMSCGTPVISTPSGVAQEIIQNFNGVLCGGFMPDDIASGIREAMMRTYDSMTIRQFMLDNFRYDKIAKQYVELYKHVVDG